MIGTMAVVEHGVVEPTHSWVRSLKKRSATQYVYRVVVDDIKRTAVEAKVTITVAGQTKRLRLSPADPADLPIQRFLLNPQPVESNLKHSASTVDGEQDINVDVIVTYPQNIAYAGAGANRVYVEF